MRVSDKRQAILEATEALVRSHRVHEITMDEIAARAHVGKGTLYRYFENKEALFFELAASGFDALCAAIEERVPTGGDFASELVTVCDAISVFHQERRALLRVMHEEEGRRMEARVALKRRLAGHRAKVENAVVVFLKGGVEQQQVRADMQLTMLAKMLLGMLRARDARCDETTEEVPSIVSIVSLFMGGAGLRVK